MHYNILRPLGIVHTEPIRHLVSQSGGVILGAVARGKTSEKGKDDEASEDDDGELAENGLASTKLGPLSVGLSDVTLDLLIAELVVDHATQSNGVAEELDTSDLSTPDDHGGDNEQDILQDTAEGQDDGGGLANLRRVLVGFSLVQIRETYQEDDRDVQHEGAETVQEESEKTDIIDLGHGALGDLPDQGNSTVHDHADGGEVVQRDQGVHLEVSRAQQALDHGESESLEDDTTNLVQNTNGHEVDFAKGRNDDTNDNGRDVEELLQVGSGNAEDPARDEDSNGSGGLEHLDESNREVEVCQVSADQTQTEKDTDGNNSAHVDARSHLDGLSAIKQVSPSGEDLCDDGRKGQVVGREDDRVA